MYIVSGLLALMLINKFKKMTNNVILLLKNKMIFVGISVSQTKNVSDLFWLCYHWGFLAVSDWSRELPHDTQTSTVPAAHTDTFAVKAHTTRHTASNSRIAILLAVVGLLLVVVVIAVIVVVYRRRGLHAFTECGYFKQNLEVYNAF